MRVDVLCVANSKTRAGATLMEVLAPFTSPAKCRLRGVCHMKLQDRQALPRFQRLGTVHGTVRAFSLAGEDGSMLPRTQGLAHRFTHGSQMPVGVADAPVKSRTSTWNWTFWAAILAFEVVGLLLSYRS